MRIPRAYYPAISTDASEIIITGQTATHLSKVLRLKIGQPVILFDGKNLEHNCTVTEIDRRNITLSIDSRESVNIESPLSITLIQSISRSDRMDWVIQKATELGVSNIIPAIAERSVVKLNDKRLKSRMKHWSGIVTHACEQCGRNTLPELFSPEPLADIFNRRTVNNGYYLEPDSGIHLTQTDEAMDICLIVGPEGGFSENEKELMNKHHIKPVKMGPRILRTETAAIAALSMIGVLRGDL